MMNLIVLFFRFLKNNIGKFALGLFLTVTFLFILFPFSDLNDLISSEVSKATHNAAFVQFDDMHINPVTATITLDQISIETPQFSNALTATELSFTPSISSLVLRKPGGSVSAKGFLKGDFKISLSPGGSTAAKGDAAKSTENGQIEKFNFDISAQNISVKDLKDLFSISLPLKGQLNIAAEGITDLAMMEQPEGEITLTIHKFELPSSTVPIGAFGPLNLPEVRLGQIELKGKLSSGKLVIETGKLGTPKDDMYADIKGDVGLTLSNINGQIIPMIGAYNLLLDMKFTPSMRARASFFMTLLDGFVGSFKKEEAGGGVQYKFRMQGAAIGLQPQFGPLL